MIKYTFDRSRLVSIDNDDNAVLCNYAMAKQILDANLAFGGLRGNELPDQANHIYVHISDCIYYAIKSWLDTGYCDQMDLREFIEKLDIDTAGIASTTRYWTKVDE